MFWFVNTYLSASGKSEGGKVPPTLFAHVRNLYLFRFEFFQSRVEVIAHQEKLMLIVLFRVVERSLELRHGKNQPAVAVIHGGKLQDIAKEGAVSFRVLGVDDNMRTVDYWSPPDSEW